VSPADAYEQSRVRIARTCDVVQDPRTLRFDVLDEVRRVVGFDAYAWVLTDPGPQWARPRWLTFPGFLSCRAKSV